VASSYTTVAPRANSFHLVKPKREAKEWTPPLDYNVTGFQLKIDEDKKEFPGQRITAPTSVEVMLLATGDFTVAWSAKEYHREQTDRARRHGFIINLHDDDKASPSNRPRWHRDNSHGYSSHPPTTRISWTMWQRCTLA
jgi:hypothetical protein